MQLLAKEVQVTMDDTIKCPFCGEQTKVKDLIPDENPQKLPRSEKQGSYFQTVHRYCACQPQKAVIGEPQKAAVYDRGDGTQLLVNDARLVKS